MTFSSATANVSTLTHEQIEMVNILPSCYPYVSVLCYHLAEITAVPMRSSPGAASVAADLTSFQKSVFRFSNRTLDPRSLSAKALKSFYFQ